MHRRKVARRLEYIRIILRTVSSQGGGTITKWKRHRENRLIHTHESFSLNTGRESRLKMPFANNCSTPEQLFELIVIDQYWFLPFSVRIHERLFQRVFCRRCDWYPWFVVSVWRYSVSPTANVIGSILNWMNKKKGRRLAFVLYCQFIGESSPMIRNRSNTRSTNTQYNNQNILYSKLYIP